MSSQTEPAASEKTRSIERHIGREVRRHRQAHQMTLADLAQATGLSPGMVSKIENGQTSPSLSTLTTLASALNLPLSAFFRSFEESRDVSYVPAGRGLEIDRRGTRAGHIYQLLGHMIRSSVSLEPYLITLTEQSEVFTEFQHEGVEFIYMLEGELIYRHGEREFTLSPGDSLFFDAIAPHGPAALLSMPARYLSIIAAPGEG
ncbi:helix-turn-helix domain-containing protein [Amorphus orientalis]|uniref:Transcriptional regulator with XRE-family HTH domain n=1 Tax=Amorphus orientalis TaxID=649198 RepID=A0AAE3VQ79_9HYPH|nr:XRE family transcriptional regulator [Amorphus orientalis]MDQ0316102.1 transcriptional regulator with XRE-family HTH domain [Amorphus orientalis]